MRFASDAKRVLVVQYGMFQRPAPVGPVGVRPGFVFVFVFVQYWTSNTIDTNACEAE